MSKFKVGDVVKRTFDVQSYCLCQGSPVGTITSVGPMGWLQIDGWSDTSGDKHPWSPQCFVLRDKQADDPLPPAPTSVLYNDEYPDRSAYKQTWLAVESVRQSGRLYISTGQYGTNEGVGLELTVDAALQLAHDIRRMAMDIRRKERHVQA